MRKKLKILIVDDEESNRNALGRLFRKKFDVSLAPDGEKALEMILAGEYDAVLSDFNMPKMDGQALYEALAEQRPEMARRTVFMTGGPKNERGVRFFVGRPFLTKPIDVADAIGAILHAASQP